MLFLSLIPINGISPAEQDKCVNEIIFNRKNAKIIF